MIFVPFQAFRGLSSNAFQSIFAGFSQSYSTSLHKEILSKGAEYQKGAIDTVGCVILENAKN